MEKHKRGGVDDGFDNTHLSMETALEMNYINRDYITHVWRWEYVCKWLGKTYSPWGGGHAINHAHILDLGCGREFPLPKTLSAFRLYNWASYTGVDINKLEIPSRFSRRVDKLKMRALGEKDALTLTEEDFPHGKPNLIVSFEVLEHVPYEHGKNIMKKAYDISQDSAVFILSQPVFDPKKGMAQNHVAERTREELLEVLEFSGWKVKDNFGTFGDQAAIKPLMNDAQREVWDQISQYHCAETLANFMAPLFPQASRNNIWVLTK